jgi:hypothetical protein
MSDARNRAISPRKLSRSMMGAFAVVALHCGSAEF